MDYKVKLKVQIIVLLVIDYKQGLIKPDWIEAGELTDNDMLAFPIPTYEKDISSITEEDCYMYGVILGDGHLSNKDMNGYISLQR